MRTSLKHNLLQFTCFSNANVGFRDCSCVQSKWLIPSISIRNSKSWRKNICMIYMGKHLYDLYEKTFIWWAQINPSLGFSTFSYRKCLFFSTFSYRKWFVVVFPRTQWPSLPCRSQWAMLWWRSQWFPHPGRMTGREAPTGNGFLSRRRRRKHSWTSHPKVPCSGHAEGVPGRLQHFTPLSAEMESSDGLEDFVNTEYLFLRS